MPTFNLAALETRVYDGLDNNQAEFPEFNVRCVINEAMARLNVITGFNRATVTVTGGTVAGQLEYAIPAGILFPTRCDYNGRELSAISMKRLGAKHRNWSVMTTANGPVTRWARLGLTKFILNPIDLHAGNVLEVTGVSPLVPLVNANDPVVLDDQYVDIVIDYCKQRLPLKEGGAEFATGSLAYRDMTRKLKTMTMWRSMRFPAYWLISSQQQSTRPVQE